QRRFHAGAHGRVFAAGGIDQPRGKAFLVVDQDLEQMLGRELLIAFAQGQTLRRLNKAARPLGEFLDIHQSSSPPFSRHGSMASLRSANGTNVGSSCRTFKRRAKVKALDERG